MQDTLKPGVSQFIDTNTVPGQIYNYRVLTLPAAGSRSSSAASPLAPEPSDYSAAVTVQALPEPPKTPPAPTVTARSATELRLTWTPSLMDAVTLHVLRQGPGETLSETIASLPGGVTEFTDSELEPASKYAYWLQAFNDAGESPPGDPGHGSTFAQTVPAPSLVVVHPLDTMTFEVCWTPGDPGLPTVVARRMAGQVQLEYMGTVDPGGTCFTDTNASFYMYEYWVKHRDLDGENESDWARSALTPAPGFNLGYNRIYLPLILKD
jgi:hypothetical protein